MTNGFSHVNVLLHSWDKISKLRTVCSGRLQRGQYGAQKSSASTPPGEPTGVRLGPRPKVVFVFYKKTRDVGELPRQVVIPGPWSLGGHGGKSGGSRQQKLCLQGVPVLWCLRLEQTNKKLSSARLLSLLIQRWVSRSLPFSLLVPI